MSIANLNRFVGNAIISDRTREWVTNGRLVEILRENNLDNDEIAEIAAARAQSMSELSAVIEHMVARQEARARSNSVAAALIDYYGVNRLPVPVRTFITSPPPDLVRDISLIEGASITFCDAVWVRLINGQGVIFVNGNLPEVDRRYTMACALFFGLCAARGGRAMGLYDAACGTANQFAEQFGRLLLMPVELLPTGWELMPAEELARIADVPIRAAELRLCESGLRQSPPSFHI